MMMLEAQIIEQRGLVSIVEEKLLTFVLPVAILIMIYLFVFAIQPPLTETFAFCIIVKSNIKATITNNQKG
jgi:hypothetical protein